MNQPKSMIGAVHVNPKKLRVNMEAQLLLDSIWADSCHL